MDVRLPNGQTIANVPEGTTQAQLVAKLRANGYDTSWYKEPASPGFLGSVKEAISNIPASAGRFASGIGSSIMHPVDTATGLLDIGAGALQSALAPKSWTSQRGSFLYDPQSAEAWNAAKEFYKERYGGLHNIGRTLVQDPVGTAADVASVLAPVAGVGKIADVSGLTKVGDAARAVSKIGDLVNPARVSAEALKPLLTTAARKLMQSAIKPTVADLKSGDAAVAISELLKRGLSPNEGGLNAIKERIGELDSKVQSLVDQSNGRVTISDAARSMSRALRKFSNQVNSEADIAALRRSWSEFRSKFMKMSGWAARKQAAEDALAKARDLRARALQDAWKYKTFSAQQENLAHGGAVRLSPDQTANEPYMNVGVLGRTAQSPSSFPVSGMPRMPGRYTENIARVPEGESAASDLFALAIKRAKEEEAARETLARVSGERPSISASEAHALKRGTYAALGDKPYERLLNPASTEGEKAIASGLRQGVLKAVPETKEALEEESRLMKTLSVTERRALMEANKNPMGISLIARNPKTWALFMADRSAAFKALLARMLYRMPLSVSSPVAKAAVVSERSTEIKSLKRAVEKWGWKYEPGKYRYRVMPDGDVQRARIQ